MIPGLEVPFFLRRHFSSGRSWFGAAVIGALVYLSVTAFSPYRDDNLQRVTANVFVAAAVLMLSPLLRGCAGVRVPPRRRWLLLALAGSALVSTVLAPRWPAAWDRLQLYFGIALLGLAVYLLHRDDDHPTILPYLMAISIAHAFVLIEIVFWIAQLHTGEATLARRMPYHGNVRHFGYLGYLGAAAGAALVMVSRNLLASALLLCASALFGIVQLGSRGALLAWALFAAAGALISPRRLRFLGLALCAAALAFGLVRALDLHGLPANGDLLTRATSGETFRTRDRLALWEDALHGVAERPLFGWGPEGHAASKCCAGRGLYIGGTVQPHNLILQLLLEFGLVGTVLLGALAADILLRHAQAPGWRGAILESPDLQALAAILAGFTAFGMIDGLFYYPVPLIHFATLTGLLLAYTRHRPSKPAR